VKNNIYLKLIFVIIKTMIEYKSMKDVNGNVYCVKIQKPFVQQTNKKHYNIQNVNKDCLLSYCHSYRH